MEAKERVKERRKKVQRRKRVERKVVTRLARAGKVIKESVSYCNLIEVALGIGKSVMHLFLWKYSHTEVSFLIWF